MPITVFPAVAARDQESAFFAIGNHRISRSSPSDDNSVHAPMTRLAGFRAIALVFFAVARVVVLIPDS